MLRPSNTEGPSPRSSGKLKNSYIHTNSIPPSSATLPIYQKDAQLSLFDQFIIANNLALQNYEAPTWSARGLSSTVDYTLTRKLDIEHWKISSYYSQSDHVYIEFTIPGIPMLTPNKNVEIHINKEKFRTLIKTPPFLLSYTSPENTEINTLSINTWIATALRNSSTTVNTITKPHYWNPNLHTISNTIKKLHKKSQ